MTFCFFALPDYYFFCTCTLSLSRSLVKGSCVRIPRTFTSSFSLAFFFFFFGGGGGGRLHVVAIHDLEGSVSVSALVLWKMLEENRC